MPVSYSVVIKKERWQKIHPDSLRFVLYVRTRRNFKFSKKDGARLYPVAHFQCIFYPDSRSKSWWFGQREWSSFSCFSFPFQRCGQREGRSFSLHFGLPFQRWGWCGFRWGQPLKTYWPFTTKKTKHHTQAEETYAKNVSPGFVFVGLCQSGFIHTFSTLYPYGKRLH